MYARRSDDFYCRTKHSILIVNDKYHPGISLEIKQHLLAACEVMLANDMWINAGAIIRGILIESGKVTGWIGLFTHGFDLSSISAGLFYPQIKDIFTMQQDRLVYLYSNKAFSFEQCKPDGLKNHPVLPIVFQKKIHSNT